MTDIVTVFVVSMLVLAAYSYLAIRLSKTAQPLRIKIAENIEDLLCDESIPQTVRDDLDTLGDRLLSRKLAWQIVLTFPIGVYFAIKGNGSENRLVRSHSRYKEIGGVFLEGIMCIMANSPLAALLFAFEVVILMLLAVPLGRSARRALHMVFSYGAPREAHTTA